MITEHDLQEAIAECEGQRNPTASTCLKLAAFYTIKEHMYGEGSVSPVEPHFSSGGYSYGQEIKSVPEGILEAHSGTEFAELVDGMPVDDFFKIMDELMSTIHIVQPRLYNSVIRKLRQE